jgi:hypothetical protein
MSRKRKLKPLPIQTDEAVKCAHWCINNNYIIHFEADPKDERFVFMYVYDNGETLKCEERFMQYKFRNKEPEHWDAMYRMYINHYNKYNNEQEGKL